jgi:hypothetical protein
MTEREWLEANDPEPLLRYLEEQPEPASERKARLFAVACCRRVWDLLPDDCCRDAVGVIERFADGKATERELALARRPALSAAGRRVQGQAAWAVYHAGGRRVLAGLWHVCTCAAEAVADRHKPEAWHAASAALTVIAREQARLLRECFGNPFHDVSVESEWLDWQAGTVRRLALAAYAEEAFDGLPVLADALEEAGCTDADILGHCRGVGEHVRGCWVVDLLLGKQ